MTPYTNFANPWEIIYSALSLGTVIISPSCTTRCNSISEYLCKISIEDTLGIIYVDLPSTKTSSQVSSFGSYSKLYSLFNFEITSSILLPSKFIWIELVSSHPNSVNTGHGVTIAGKPLARAWTKL